MILYFQGATGCCNSQALAVNLHFGPTSYLSRRMHCSDGGALKGLSPHALCKNRASECCSMKFTNTGANLFINLWMFVYVLESSSTFLRPAVHVSSSCSFNSLVLSDY